MFRVGVVVAVLLALTACGPKPAEESAPYTEAASGDPSALMFCEEVGRRLTVQECNDLGAASDAAKEGSAAFNVPSPMQRDKPETLRLAISLQPRPVLTETEPTASAAPNPTSSAVPESTVAEVAEPEPDPAAPIKPASATRPTSPERPADVVDPAYGDTREYSPVVGRFMAAELTGDGFKIEPVTPRSQEVLKDSVTVWEWRVTAIAGGKRQLLLKTVVEAQMANGERLPLRSTTHSEDVDVTVGIWGLVQDTLTTAPLWIKLLTGAIAALAGLIGAIVGLKKAFGGKNK